MKDITRPTLLLDENICRANIRRMKARADQYQVKIRPHFKTHQSAEIASWCRDEGISSITVSSVSMAKYFASHGWDDITIAFPLNFREWKDISRLAQEIRLNVVLTSPAALDPLLSTKDVALGVFVKIDVGTHRTGFDPGNPETILQAMMKIKEHPSLKLRGLLCHTGHTYASRSPNEIQHTHEKARQIMVKLSALASEQFSGLTVSMGDTPSSSVAEEWDGVDEIRPGNFVFYDLMQVQIGSCQLQDIAVCLACPVVGKHPVRRKIIIYGGGIHLSKDRLTWQSQVIYGLPVLLTEDGWKMPDSGSSVVSVSQEHGVIQASEQLMQQLDVGDLVGILPVHSCMTADLMAGYQLVSSHSSISMMNTNKAD